MQLTPSEFSQLQDRAEESVRKMALPPCPGILAQIALEVRSETPDVRKVADLIARDVASAAGILKTVNSAFYGLAATARSVQQAIALLGLDRTALLLAGLLLRNAFPRSERAEMKHFWQSSAQLAVLVGFFARVLGGIERDEAHTFGLFRDAGTAVLIARFPDHGAVMTARAAEPGFLCTDIEKAHFGVDHAVIGGVMARDWYLPDEISDAILWHHADFVLALGSPPIRAEAVRLIALGVLADGVLARYADSAVSPWTAASRDHALRIVGLDESQYGDLQVEALTLLAERDGRPMPTMRLRRVSA